MGLHDNPAALVAADWGTSSLRVWAFSTTGSVLAERRSDEGMARLQPAGFEGVLRRHLDGMAISLAGAPDPLPVVVCGMAGARQGWREAAYADVPADIGSICGQARTVPAEGLDVRILPGLAVRTGERDDVMRGEETQLLGLLQAEPRLSGLVCLPGTHSKWVQLEAGRVTDFSTAMTGEVFALLGQSSVLRYSLGDAQPGGDPGSPGFVRGVGRGLAMPGHLLMHLFGVRAASLLRGVQGVEAADTLSGLLIGAEIGGMALPSSAPVVLVADGAMAQLYGKALSMAGHPVRTMGGEAAVQRGLVYAAQILWPGWNKNA